MSQNVNPTTAPEDALWEQAQDYRERDIDPMANRSTDPGVAEETARPGRIRNGHGAVIAAILISLMGAQFGLPGFAAVITLATYALTRRLSIGWKVAAIWTLTSGILGIVYQLWPVAAQMLR